MPTINYVSSAKCAHPLCNNGATVKTTLYRRGERAVYLCEFHAYGKYAYHQMKNNLFVGTPKADGFTVGLELETSFSTVKARAELMTEGYIPTADCTCDVEYVSPIMHGFNIIMKHAETIDALIKAREMKINFKCGTHTHIGNRMYINETTNGYMREYYRALFRPLSDEMRRRPDDVLAIFGRSFRTYAMPITAYSYASAHSNFINLQHDNTLEFRLCKFRTAEQYKFLVRMLKDITATVIENFIKHYNDEYNTNEYTSIDEYRQHKAEVTARKLVKLFKKYSDNRTYRVTWQDDRDAERN